MQDVVLSQNRNPVTVAAVKLLKPELFLLFSGKVEVSLESDESVFTVFSLEASQPASLPAEDISTNSNGPKQDLLFDDDPEDLFAEATEEVSLDSPERDVLLSDGPSFYCFQMNLKVCFFVQIEEEEGGDSFDIHISVSEPREVGDFMFFLSPSSRQTSMSLFKQKDFSVKRRFSDFLGLHSKLASKYLHIGYIVPPAPEKSIVGMTKVKVGKEDQSSNEFVEKRRSALERYLMRTVKHPILLKDPDVLQFLESSEQRWTPANGNKAADAVNKMTIKMNESDAVKAAAFENLDVQLRKLHASVKLSVNTAQFAKSAAMLGNSEDHTALSRALSQLAEVEEKIDQLHQDQANGDFYLFSELRGLRTTGVFEHRMKTWQKWQDSQMLLQKKREAEAKLQFTNKPDKLQQAKDEIKELEGKVQQGERDFEQISKTIRKEVSRFEKERVKDFKTIIVKYLESLVLTQQQLIKYWEAFLPEAKAIS
uniref:Sorting nexin-2 n=1 Tax=Amphiprion percula TaxID=161767 RepID=A0A3P8U000_AMPPE